MPNSWSMKAYMQGFDFESIALKAVKGFQSMEISSSIYEGAVEPSYKNLLGQMPAVLASAVKLEQKTPCQILTPRLVRALAITVKGMQII